MIGLAAMQQNDQLDEIIEALPELVGKANCHLVLTVWSKAGPTIIKLARSDDPLLIGMPLGQVLPLTHSASGLVFSAFLERSVTRELIAKERLSYGDKNAQPQQDIEILLQTVREKRFAISRGEVQSDITAMAVPILDWENNPVAVVGAIVAKNADESRISSVLTQLQKFSEQISVEKPAFPF